MAIIFADSFDHYATADLSQKWNDTQNVAGAITAAAGRNGTSGLVFGNLGARNIVVPSAATYVFGFAVKFTSTLTNTNHQLCAFKEGTTLHVDLRYNLDGTIRCTRNGTTLASSGTTVLVINTWYYIEFKATIHDTTGSFEVKINGVVENMGTTTGLDTRNGGTGVITSVQIGNDASNTQPSQTFDDVYIDDAGYQGDVRVVALLASAAGNYAQFTPLSSTNVSNVDEASGDGDTTYNAESTVGEKDSFVMDNMPTNGTPVAVQVVSQTRKDDAGSRSLRNFLRIGGVDYEGASKIVTDSYLYQRDLWTTNPAGGALTQSVVDGAEAGYKVQA